MYSYRFPPFFYKLGSQGTNPLESKNDTTGVPLVMGS